MIKKGLPKDVIKAMQDMLDKPVQELDTYEKAFLRARATYLTKIEKDNLGDVLTRKFTEAQNKNVRAILKGEEK